MAATQEPVARALPGLGRGTSFDGVLPYLVDTTVESVLRAAVFDPAAGQVALPPLDYLLDRLRMTFDRFHAAGPRAGVAACRMFIEAIAEARGGHAAVFTALQAGTAATSARPAAAGRPGSAGRRRRQKRRR